MMTLEEKINRIIDQHTIHEVLNLLCAAVDSSSVDGILDCFSVDGVFDGTKIGLGRFEGHGEIRNFFEQTFNAMAHSAHYATNFMVRKLDADEAVGQAYVMGKAQTKDGNAIEACVIYHVSYVRTSEGWKLKSLVEEALLPFSL